MFIYELLANKGGIRLIVFSILHDVLSIRAIYELHQKLKNGEVEEEE
nr:hypothetical protein MACL_00002946 [Theileria orientalis]